MTFTAKTSDLQDLLGLCEKLGLDGIPTPEDLANCRSFREVEDLAHQAGRRLAQALMGETTRSQAEAGPEAVPCPTCQRICPTETEQRTVKTGDGPVTITEPKAHCPHCRRAFFPLATRPGPRSSRLQPQGR